MRSCPIRRAAPLRRGAPGRALGLLAVLLIGAAGSAGAVEPNIAQDELAQRLGGREDVLVLDVRTPAEFRAGHIPGAVNIPLQELQRRLGELDGQRAEELVVHCETGPRAGRAELILRGSGFTRLRVLEGHMRAWRGAGLPTTPAGCASC